MAGRLLSIIDDDEDVRQSLLALIESVGYSARLFASAEEFLASDAWTETCCILSDVQMAGMSGIELADRLAQSGSRIPIILITAYAKDNQSFALSRPGVVAVLPKPLQLNALIEQIGRALGSGAAG
ncbi:response regulator transcription factor [Bradyrhizobium sp. 5.13L]